MSPIVSQTGRVYRATVGQTADHSWSQRQLETQGIKAGKVTRGQKHPARFQNSNGQEARHQTHQDVTYVTVSQAPPTAQSFFLSNFHLPDPFNFPSKSSLSLSCFCVVVFFVRLLLLFFFFFFLSSPLCFRDG